MKLIYSFLEKYLTPKLIGVFFLGFASGLPLALSTSVLTVRLTEYGINKSTITLFSLVGLAYSFKFVWSFLLDFVPLSTFSKVFGFRRSWLLVFQIFTAISIVLLGSVNPSQDVPLTVLFATMVSFFSASQDVIIDAYRIEILGEKEQSYGAAMTTYGYRLALLFSSGGALIFSDYLKSFVQSVETGWQIIHIIMAVFVFVGIVASLFLGEPKSSTEKITRYNQTKPSEVFVKMVVDPIKNILTWQKVAVILVFVVFHKMPDAMFGTIANSFYMDMGFTKTQIGLIAKTFGLSMTLLGVFFGSVVIRYYGLYKTMFAALLLQMLSNLVFLLLLNNKGDLQIFALAISVENICGSLILVAIITYLSGLCNLSFTASQYAILSSIATIGRNFIAAPCGFLVDFYGWERFFIVSALSGIPALILLQYLPKKSLEKVT